MKHHRALFQNIVFFVLALFLLFQIASVLPNYGDWSIVYYKVAHNWQMPYRIQTFLNLPWMALLLAPFKFLDKHTSGALWISLSILAIITSIIRLKGDARTLLLAFASPPFIYFLVSGQIDAVILCGFSLLLVTDNLLAQGMGIALISVKPQVLSLAVITKLVQSKNRIMILAPLAVLTLISFLWLGWWPKDLYYNLTHNLNESVDLSPWPYGIPVGLFMLLMSIVPQFTVVSKNNKFGILSKFVGQRWQSNERMSETSLYLGGLATYFLFPYVSPNSFFIYCVVFFVFASKTVGFIGFVLIWFAAILIILF